MADPQSIWCVMPWLNNPTMTLQAVEDCLNQTVPTRVLLINQGAATEDREQIDRYIEQHSDHRVLCWHFVPSLPSLSAVWNRALAFVWELGGEEALVSNNDVRLVPKTLERLQEALQRRGALLVSAVGKSEREWTDAMWKAWCEVEPGPTDQGGPDFSCFLLSKAGHTKYPFDESFIPAFCEDLDSHRRYMLGGDGARIFSINLPYLHYASQTIKAYTPEERAKFNKGYAQVVARYTALWGGGPNQETFLRKGDPTSAVRDGTATTPYLQHHPSSPSTVRTVVPEDEESLPVEDGL